jgi:hypothetical protein
MLYQGRNKIGAPAEKDALDCKTVAKMQSTNIIMSLKLSGSFFCLYLHDIYKSADWLHRLSGGGEARVPGLVDMQVALLIVIYQYP